MVEETLQILKDNVRPVLPELLDELSPPATPGQLDEVASQLPFAFPDELKQLYSVHNGEANERGLFFGLPFISLEAAFDEWQLLADLSTDDFSDIDRNIVSVPKKHIKKNYMNMHYFPISRDGGGNYLGVDLDPDEKGTKGQIINLGSDENTRYVIAPSLEDFLAFCIREIERDNYVVEETMGETCLYLKEPDSKHFLDALPQLDLPFRASNR